MPVPAHPRLAARLAMEGVPRYMVAALARVTPSTLSAIVTGRIEPTEAQRRRIAEALRVTPGDLFDDSDGASEAA